jgi:outer membrane protein OmpA-like peptidoglycan-associated protein
MKAIPHLIASVALFFGAMGMAMAQETSVNTETTVKEEVASSRRFEVGSFKDNWFIGIGGGVNQYLGEHDRQMKFFNRLAPAMDLYFGKWFTPSLGFRIAYSGGEGFGATNLMTGKINTTGNPIAPDYLTQKFLDENSGYKGDGTDHHALYWQQFHMWNIHVDFMLNLMNVIGGYKERVYNLSPYFGIGLARAYALEDNDNRFCNNRLSGTVGLLNSFRLCDALDLNVDLRGVLVPQDFEGELGSRPGGGETYESEGYLTATIGIAYKFKPRGWSQGKTIYKTNTVTVLDQDALNAALAENKALEEQLKNAKAQTVTEVVESLLSPELYITFERNKSELSGEGKVLLMNLAKILKAADQSIVYTITGYADNQTGTVERNQELSQERAQVVYDYLVKDMGVDPAHFEMEAKGGVDAMFLDDNTLSRAVILTIKK